MTSSSSPTLERGLDTMFLVYSLLDGHPASVVSEQFIRTRTGWFTTTICLLEAKAILTKAYGVEAALATAKLARLTDGLVEVMTIDRETLLAAMNLADTLGLDLTDAMLLSSTRAHGVTKLATDDHKLAQACGQAGITLENPIDANLRQQMAAWEVVNLPAKGLARVLRQIHQWLNRTHPQTAEECWSQTGGGIHLP